MTNLKLHEDCKVLLQVVYSSIIFKQGSYINAVIKNNKNIIVINAPKFLKMLMKLFSKKCLFLISIVETISINLNINAITSGINTIPNKLTASQPVEASQLPCPYNLKLLW